MKSIIKNRKPFGTTLLEVLIACTIFSILVIAMFAIIRYCTTNWRAIEDRVAIQSEIRQIQSNISDNLLTSSYATVRTYMGDYRHALAFETFVNPDTGVFDTNNQGEPQSHGYLLFFIVRPTTDPCTHTPISAGVTDNICPHKILVRVDLTRNNDSDEGGSNTWPPITFADGAALLPYMPSEVNDKYFTSREITIDDYKDAIDGDGKYVSRVRIIARNVLSFDVENNADEPWVHIVVRAFKAMEAGSDLKVGVDELNTSLFTIQVDNYIIPQNP